jgi:hypothetical protein
MKVSSMLRQVAKDVRGKQWLKQLVGLDWWRNGQRFVHRWMRVDQRANRYDETISDPETGKPVVDPSTGEPLRDVHEPLDQHRNRGSAKPAP